MTSDMPQARRPVTTRLAGRYGHPYHPALTSVPIGAWVASLVFDVASHTVGKPGFLTAGSEWLIAIGIVGAFVAAVPGFVDLVSIAPGSRAYRIACAHVSINALVISGYAADFGWRRHSYQLGAPVSAGLLTLSAACLVLLGMSGFLGGTLAYRYGVRVADKEAAGYLPQRSSAHRSGRGSASPGATREADTRWE